MPGHLSSSVSGRVRLPADVELPDKLAFNLDVRQLTALGATGLVGYGLFSLAKQALPLPIAAALVAPVVLVGVLLAFGRRDGLSGDQLALAALRFLAQPRLRLLAPDGLPTTITGAPPRPRAATLNLPVRAVVRSGLVDLGNHGFCRLLRASASSFALRTEEEQEAMVAAFARYLNGLTQPVEISVRSEPVNLDSWAAALTREAAASNNSALVAAAADHARFTAGLGERAEVRRREILLILHARRGERAAVQAELERRVAETVELLRAAGVELRPLDGPQTVRLLARLLDPPGPAAGSELEGTVTRAC
ncbi:MAG: PrgI family protein [Solirubrobacterales bacterium]